MGYCGPRGIPHEGEFLTWSASDRSKALWWHIRDLNKCPKCGTRGEEWDPSKGGRRDAYHGQIHLCQGCVVKERTEEAPELEEGRGKSVVLVKAPEVAR